LPGLAYQIVLTRFIPAIGDPMLTQVKRYPPETQQAPPHQRPAQRRPPQHHWLLAQRWKREYPGHPNTHQQKKRKQN
jgi:hypothetical protein